MKCHLFSLRRSTSDCCWPLSQRETGKRHRANEVQSHCLLGVMENLLQFAATPLQHASAGDSPPTTLNIKHQCSCSEYRGHRNCLIYLSFTIHIRLHRTSLLISNPHIMALFDHRKGKPKQDILQLLKKMTAQSCQYTIASELCSIPYSVDYNCYIHFCSSLPPPPSFLLSLIHSHSLDILAPSVLYVKRLKQKRGAYAFRQFLLTNFCQRNTVLQIRSRASFNSIHCSQFADFCILGSLGFFRRSGWSCAAIAVSRRDACEYRYVLSMSSV